MTTVLTKSVTFLKHAARGLYDLLHRLVFTSRVLRPLLALLVLPFHHRLVRNPSTLHDTLVLIGRSRRLSPDDQWKLLARPMIPASLMSNPRLVPSAQLAAAFNESLLGYHAFLARNPSLTPEAQYVLAGYSSASRTRTGLINRTDLDPRAEELLTFNCASYQFYELLEDRDLRWRLGFSVEFLGYSLEGTALLNKIRAIDPEVYDVLAPGFAGSGEELQALVEDFAKDSGGLSTGSSCDPQ